MFNTKQLSTVFLASILISPFAFADTSTNTPSFAAQEQYVAKVFNQVTNYQPPNCTRNCSKCYYLLF